jgi:hypothetical protein
MLIARNADVHPYSRSLTPEHVNPARFPRKSIPLNSNAPSSRAVRPDDPTATFHRVRPRSIPDDRLSPIGYSSMRQTMGTRLLACLVLMPASAAMFSAGCGGADDDHPRQPVSGTVKFQGEPLKSGLIQFQPASADASTAGGAGIVDGQYSISRAEGLVPGSYRVSITSLGAAATPLPAGATPGDPVMKVKEPIPARYNATTELKAQVTKEGPNKFDFDLKSK